MTRKLWALLTVVGITGAVGQAALLFHSLVDTYPYKMMSYPSHRFYEGIAYVGFLLATIAAGLAGGIFLRRVPYSAPAVACLACPTTFFLVFAVAHAILGVDMGNMANFDDTTPGAVFGEFAEQALKLLLAGGAIGGLCGLLVAVAFRVTSVPSHNKG